MASLLKHRLDKWFSGREAATSPVGLFELVKPFTFAAQEKLANLRHLALRVRADNVAGDVVECGTFRGGSAAVLGTTLSESQRLWLYDSFQGMPPVSDKDGQDAARYVGKGVATEQDVIEILSKTGVGRERYIIRKGWFEDTFVAPMPETVSILHCDADWYESVLLVLETFYPRVAPKGCIVLDDFGYWEGCREAFYAFCAKHQVRPLLERHGVDQAWWFKDRAHNRS